MRFINSLFSKGDSVNSRYSKGIEHIKKFYNSYYNQDEFVKELDYHSHVDEKNSKKEKYYRDYIDEKNSEKEKDDYDFSL